MAEQGYKRKLTAILSTDGVGYSRLMRDDEDGTILTLTTYRSAIIAIVEKFRGNVVDATGDNLLAEFSSVVDAVNCGVEIQRELAERNAELPDERKMHFRIGINLGDVVKEEDRIYGDGVNIAARMESMAEPGGICISGSVHDSVESQMGLGFEYLGEQEVKNIDKPVRAYRVASYPGAEAYSVVQANKALGRKWRKIAISAAVVVVIAVGLGIWQFYTHRPSIEPASVENMSFPLPDKPSIAVLAFDNLSGEPEKEYLSDGIAENIITALSKAGELFVIARNSSFTYKGKPVKVQQVSQELGVRYVLEGSLQKSGDRVRITAQLIDAIKGQHLWAEKYDRLLKDIFEIQDEITLKIVTALRVKLTKGEEARITAKQTKNLDVYLKVAQTNSLWNDGTKESLIRVGQLAQEIVDMEPDNSIGYKWLGVYHYDLANRGISPEENFKKAIAYAQKAVSLDESDAVSHSLLGQIYTRMKNIEKAIESEKRAVELMPNGALVNCVYGITLGYAERFDEGIAYLKQAIRLQPFPPYYFYFHLGRCYYWKGRYEDALAEYQKALQRAPNAALPYFGIAITYIKLNREEEARLSAAKALKIFPNFSVTLSKKTWAYKTQAGLEDMIDAMRKAGFPE